MEGGAAIGSGGIGADEDVDALSTLMRVVRPDIFHDDNAWPHGRGDDPSSPPVRKDN
jgi:hypothetical protein